MRARESLESLLGSHELLARLARGEVDRDTLRVQICPNYPVGKSAADKAIIGIYAVAELAGEEQIAKILGRSGFQTAHRNYPRVDIPSAKRELLERFALFTGRTGGIDGWLNYDTPDITFERLTRIRSEPLTAPQFNQLLTLSHAPPLFAGFFHYYWLSKPQHTYDLETIPGFRPDWEDSLGIFDLDQLYWGLYRFYTDALFYFGNVRRGYQVLREMDPDALSDFFARYRVDTGSLIGRGPSLALLPVSRDDRYLIAEQACKSYAPADEDGVDIETALRSAFRDYHLRDSAPITVGSLLSKDGDEYIARTYPDKQTMFEFAADEILGKVITSEDDLNQNLRDVKNRFGVARDAALQNTKRYLSSVGDLDVYVATSMRFRQDFHTMADFCQTVFGHRSLRKYNLRYFDPTLSAAANHEDKGIIECLMVKCAKILVYTAGDKDSWGKDAEAAMASSLGKPVIFFCGSQDREKFYRDIHPLSRLVDFRTGVAVGVMVTDSEDEVSRLIDLLLRNSMQYELEQKRPGYLVVKEKITGCVVRLQTSDDMLRETFWNHYHGVQGSAHPYAVD